MAVRDNIGWAGKEGRPKSATLRRSEAEIPYAHWMSAHPKWCFEVLSEAD